MAGETRYLGIGEEPGFGIPVSPSVYLDYISAGIEVPTDSLLVFGGAGSRGQISVVPGPYIPSGDLQVGMDIVNAVYLLKWGMGRYGVNGTDSNSGDTTLDSEVAAGEETIVVGDESDFSVNDYVQISTGIGADVVQLLSLDGGAGPTYTWTVTSLLNHHNADAEVRVVESPFSHQFRPTLERALPSFTARLGKSLFEHIFTGATIDGLSLSVDRGFLTCTANVQCQKDSQLPLNRAAKSFPANILTFRNANTYIADHLKTSNVESFGIEISNNIDPSAGVRHGSRFPVELPVQGVDVSGSFTFAFNSLDEYSRFWGASSGITDEGGTSFKLEQQFNVDNHWLKFVIGSAYWSQISSPVSGRNRVTQEVQFACKDDPIWDLIHIEVINDRVRY